MRDLVSVKRPQTPEQRRLRRNDLARIRRWMKRYDLTREQARIAIAEWDEHRAQGPDEYQEHGL